MTRPDKNVEDSLDFLPYHAANFDPQIRCAGYAATKRWGGGASTLRLARHTARHKHHGRQSFHRAAWRTGEGEGGGQGKSRDSIWVTDAVLRTWRLDKKNKWAILASSVFFSSRPRCRKTHGRSTTTARLVLPELYVSPGPGFIDKVPMRP